MASGAATRSSCTGFNWIRTRRQDAGDSFLGTSLGLLHCRAEPRCFYFYVSTESGRGDVDVDADTQPPSPACTQGAHSAGSRTHELPFPLHNTAIRQRGEYKISEEDKTPMSPKHHSYPTRFLESLKNQTPPERKYGLHVSVGIS